MTTPPNQPRQATDQLPARLSPSSLLRAAADGELTPAHKPALDEVHRSDSAAAARIAFEQSLKSACSRVMSADARTPDSLRNRVRIALDSDPSHSAPADAAPLVHPAGRDSAHIRSRRLRLGTLLAAAAAIAITGIVVLLVVANRPILPSNWANNHAAPPINEIVRILPATYLAKEHCECSIGNPSKISLRPTKPIEVDEKYRSLLGRSIGADDVEKAGFKLIGDDRCRLPGQSEDAVHLIFSRQSGDHEARLSVFIQRETGPQRFTEGVTWSTRAGAGELDNPHILAWYTDGLVYFLVCECPETSNLAREEFHGPADVLPFGPTG